MGLGLAESSQSFRWPLQAGSRDEIKSENVKWPRRQDLGVRARACSENESMVSSLSPASLLYHGSQMPRADGDGTV